MDEVARGRDGHVINATFVALEIKYTWLVINQTTVHPNSLTIILSLPLGFYIQLCRFPRTILTMFFAAKLLVLLVRVPVLAGL